MKVVQEMRRSHCITIKIIHSSVKNRENDSENKVIPNHKQKVLYIEGY
jgi:hypothetical protein